MGSAMLGAHNANVSFGNVIIRSLDIADAFPIISDVSVEANEYNATVRWLTSKPATSNVSYGLSSSYEYGSVVDATLVYSHAIFLNGLTQNTTYHYMINSTDNGGNSTYTADLNTTKAIRFLSIITQPVNQTTFNGSTATFSIISPGYEGNNASKLEFSSGGTTIQLYQDGITLEPNTRYRLSFAAYSTTGHDVKVNLIGIPYSDYGLSQTFDLGTNWQTNTAEFTTKGFTVIVSNGRLQFWLADSAAAGDIYYIDDVRLENVIK